MRANAGKPTGRLYTMRFKYWSWIALLAIGCGGTSETADQNSDRGSIIAHRTGEAYESDAYIFKDELENLGIFCDVSIESDCFVAWFSDDYFAQDRDPIPIDQMGLAGPTRIEEYDQVLSAAISCGYFDDITLSSISEMEEALDNAADGSILDLQHLENYAFYCLAIHMNADSSALERLLYLAGSEDGASRAEQVLSDLSENTGFERNRLIGILVAHDALDAVALNRAKMEFAHGIGAGDYDHIKTVFQAAALASSRTVSSPYVVMCIFKDYVVSMAVITCSDMLDDLGSLDGSQADSLIVQNTFICDRGDTAF
jgi:hypothetical protein